MFDVAELVSDIPKFWTTAVDGGAALHVLIDGTVVVAIDVRADHGTGNCAACGSQILTAPAANLVPKHAAENAAENRAADIAIIR